MSKPNQNRFLLPTNSSGQSGSADKTQANISATANSQDGSNSSGNNCKSTSASYQIESDQENSLSVDTDFDSYWEEEARNPNRNRIRIGRQYQATVPALLKNGEKDQRKLDELETLSFCPKKSSKLSDSEMEHYFTVAKSLSLFASLVETRSLLGRDVTIADLNHIRRKEGLSLASVIQPTRQHQPSTNSSHQASANNAPSIEIVASSGNNSGDRQPSPSSGSTNTPGMSLSSSTARDAAKQHQLPNQPLMKALSHFISLHHPCHHDSNCKKLLKEAPLNQDDTISPVSITTGNLRPGTIGPGSSAASSASGKDPQKNSRSRSALKQLKEESALETPIDNNDSGPIGTTDPADNSTTTIAPRSVVYDDWTREEVEQFSKAIEVCGKNFGSIKKDFLPSKSVKSIVEYYYIGSRDSSESKKRSSQVVDNSDACGSFEKPNHNSGGQGGGGGGSGSSSGGTSNIKGEAPTARSTSAASGSSSTSSRTAASNFNNDSSNPTDNMKLSDSPPNAQTSETLNSGSGRHSISSKAKQSIKTESSSITAKSKQSSGKKTDPRMSVYNFDDENRDDSPVRFDCPKPGAEVKPLKAKPIVPGASIDSDAANPNVGSLKFFMDGQLVLKLNACQEQQEGGDKCHWVQSGEKMANSRQKRYTKRSNQSRSSSQNGGSQSNSLVSSYQDEDSKRDLSGDEDSKESNMSNSNLSNQKLQQHQQIQQNHLQQGSSPNSKRLRIKNEPNAIRQSEGQQLSSPVEYNNLTSGANNNAVPANPMISQAMPWLNANSFAVAAALLGGFSFPQNQPNVMENLAQLPINNTNTNNNINMANNINSGGHSVGINQSSKPMDLSLEHSTPSPKPIPKSSRSRNSSRPKHT